MNKSTVVGHNKGLQIAVNPIVLGGLHLGGGGELVVGRAVP